MKTPWTARQRRLGKARPWSYWHRSTTLYGTKAPPEKTNFYGLVGVGINRFKAEAVETNSPGIQPKEYSLQTQGNMGMGFSVRLNNRFNVSLESKLIMVFGKDSDRLDAVVRQKGDVISYTAVRLNYNIGNAEKKSEPLYWVNPMNAFQAQITELKKRPVFDLTDTDGDGVIDLLDEDNLTPPGVQVDTRGLPLDSDEDGIPNHKDLEPFTPSDEEGAIIGEPYATESDIERIITERLYEYDQTGEVPQPGMEGKGGNPPSFNPMPRPKKKQGKKGTKENNLANWFLPPVHFDIDSYKIRPMDLGNLSGMAKLMQSNPDLKLAITGFADKTASEGYNKQLSFKRAESVIHYMVRVHSLKRERFILQYSGEDAPLVPSAGSNLMNRRVEFRAASESDEEMSAPPVPEKKRKGF